MIKTTAIGFSWLVLAGLAAGAVGQDQSKAEPSKTVQDVAKLPTRVERAKAIKAEFEAACKACFAGMEQGKTKAEQNAIFKKLYPDDLVYYRRSLELANEDPKDQGARDAWIWVVADGMRNNDAIGPRAELIGKAVEGLLLHHSDDLRVARTALNIDNTNSHNRRALTRGLAEKAKSHTTKGVAILALAMYLQTEAGAVEEAHESAEQPKDSYLTNDEAGNPKTVEGPKRYDDAYWDSLKKLDELAIRRESEALYAQVIAEYADVPLNPWHYVGGKLVKNPHPKSLADHARAKLDDLHILAVGKPAPEIEGVDLDGKPLKLSDYKGKVVAVVFWNSGCGPCLAAIPGERALLERLKGKPFAILGVNTDENPEAARKAVKDHNIPYPNWMDGREGPILDLFHVNSFPTTFVIDPDGIICAKHAEAGSLDEIAEVLLQAMEAKPPSGK